MAHALHHTDRVRLFPKQDSFLLFVSVEASRTARRLGVPVEFEHEGRTFRYDEHGEKCMDGTNDADCL